MKNTNEQIVEAFRRQLREVAGFQYVAKPLPMRNRNRAIVYYLLFASTNATGGKIVSEIFERYRNKGYR